MSDIMVSVLFPVYNAEAFLKEAVDSILSQTYTDFELLAIDDGSTDSSHQMLEAYDDERIRIVRNEQNLGLIGTLNRGIPLAKGKYIVRADADDICLPERLAKQVAFMEKNPNIGISGTGFGTFSEGVALSEKGKFQPEHLEIKFRHLYQIHLMHGTSIWRKEVFEVEELQFNPDFAHAEDYDLFERASQVTELSNIPDILYHVRVRPDSVSYQFNDVQERNSIRIKKRSFGRLGMDVSEEKLELFRDLCHLDHKKLHHQIIAVANLITEMLEANRTAQYFPAGFLTGRLGELWKGLVLNVPHSAKRELKMIRQHPISDFFPLSMSEILKIQIKAFIK